VRLIAIGAVLVFGLSSCRRLPEFYPPPEQHPPSQEGQSAAASFMFVDMADPTAPLHFVKDFPVPPHDGWVFAGQAPTIKVLALATQNVKFHAELSLWDVAFKQTGPVELQFRVNKFDLAKVRYDSPGAKIFDQPVPPQFLDPGQEATLSISIDKPWVAPNDGRVYGFILQRIGLQRTEVAPK
jgi:hypothetical protein